MVENLSSKQIKAYVIKTLRQGNKERIQKVLKRYFTYLKENKTGEQIKLAKDIFL